MLDDFLIRAAVAGAGVAMATGPLGAFVVWRRMAYFGDATAHAAILGVALALAFGGSVIIGILAVVLAMGLAVSYLSARGHAMDATLGVLSHAALAVGLVAVSFFPSVRIDLSALLFGDILAVGERDILVIWVGALAVSALIVWRWRPLLTATLNPELAASAGIDPRREELALTLALAVVVAIAIKVVGALLIAAMLIIPASAARVLARSPEAMALGGIVLGIVAVGGGLLGSLALDTPAGPSIVTVAAALYAVSLALDGLLRAARSRAR